MEDLLVRAQALGLQALALTDHDNLCGAMHFAQVAKTLGIPVSYTHLTLPTIYSV